MAVFFRDGSLSTFSGALDQFTIKSAFTPGGPNAATTLVKAEDINHYADACIRIQQYLLSKLGKTFATLDNSLDKAPNNYTYGSGLIGSATHTMTFSSLASLTVATQTLNVPAAFGATPFQNRTFSILPTFVINDTSGLFSQGLSYYNMVDGDMYSHLQALPQFYVTIHPTAPASTNQFVLAVRSPEATATTVKGIAQLLTGNVVDNLDYLNVKTTQSIKTIEPFYWNEPLNSNYSTSANIIADSNNTKYIRLYSTKQGQPNSSLVLSRVAANANCSIEATYKSKLSGPTLARVGMGLFNGNNAASVTGWLLVIEDGTTAAALNTATIKLLEVQNVNLGAFASSATIPAWGSGTITTLSTITLPTNNGVRLAYNGTSVTVTNTTTSTVLFTTSSLGISGNFTPGFFSKAESNSTATTNNSNVYAEFKTPFTSIAAVTTPTIKVNLLYVQSTAPANVSNSTF